MIRITAGGKSGFFKAIAIYFKNFKWEYRVRFNIIFFCFRIHILYYIFTKFLENITDYVLKSSSKYVWNANYAFSDEAA